MEVSTAEILYFSGSGMEVRSGDGPQLCVSRCCDFSTASKSTVTSGEPWHRPCDCHEKMRLLALTRWSEPLAARAQDARPVYGTAVSGYLTDGVSTTEFPFGKGVLEMNRALVYGLMLFAAVIGISLLNSEPATATQTADCCGCYSCSSCSSCCCGRCRRAARRAARRCRRCCCCWSDCCSSSCGGGEAEDDDKDDATEAEPQASRVRPEAKRAVTTTQPGTQPRAQRFEYRSTTFRST